MESRIQQRALLLGLVEVLQPLELLDEEGRARMFTLCHTAAVAGHVDDTGWLGWQERGLMGVEVVLDLEHLHVISNEVLVSQHSLAEVDAIVVVQGTDGHLVVVGQCQVNGLPLAVVLDMMSEVDARRLEEDVRQRLLQLAPFSEQPSAPEDTEYLEPLPHMEHDPSNGFPHTSDSSVPQHTVQLPVHASASPTHANSFVSNVPDAAMIMNTPLVLLRRAPPTTLVSTKPASTPPVSISLMSTPTAPTDVAPSPTSTPTMSSHPVSLQRPKSKFWPSICCCVSHR